MAGTWSSHHGRQETWMTPVQRGTPLCPPVLNPKFSYQEPIFPIGKEPKDDWYFDLASKPSRVESYYYGSTVHCMIISQS